MTLFLLKLKSDFDFSFLQKLWSDFINFLPQLLKGVAFLIIGWLLIKLILFIVKKSLGYTKIDSLPERLKVDEVFGNSGIKIQPTGIIITTIKWVFILLLILVGSELLGLRMISEQLSYIIAYLPIFTSALIIFVIGIYVANFVRKTISTMFKSLELTGGNLVGNIAFYIVATIVSVTALNQAGVNTDLITNNLTVILVAILASFTIAFGLGAKDVIKRLLFGYYSRKNLQVGQTIKVEGVEGVIESIDNICMVMVTKTSKMVLPIKDVVDQKIEIKNI